MESLQQTISKSRKPKLLVPEASYDIRTIQDLLGHNNVKTTMDYTNVLNKGPKANQGPVDVL